ncbi:MAG TPA: hypothetical protein VF575_00670 [Candidatus Saccharimonadales bacterium]|jgi:hypothetical protein
MEIDKIHGVIKFDDQDRRHAPDLIPDEIPIADANTLGIDLLRRAQTLQAEIDAAYGYYPENNPHGDESHMIHIPAINQATIGRKILDAWLEV